MAGRDPRQGALDVLVRDRRRLARQFDIAKVLGHDFRHQLDRHGVFEVLALVELDVGDLRLQNGAHALLGERLGRGLGQRLLEHLAPDRAAESLAQHRLRHLAGAESGQLHGRFQLFETARDTAFDVLFVDDDLELALEAVGARLGDDHVRVAVRFTMAD